MPSMSVQPGRSAQLLPLTVLVSFHNNQVFLDKLLNSILVSNFQNWIHEIIVIDSGSDSPPRLPLNSNLSIQTIYNPLGSLTTSLNIGLRHAKSEWICILDCDTEIIDRQFWTIIEKIHNQNISIAIPASLSSANTTAECFDFVDTVLLGYLFSKRLISPLLRAYYQKKSRLLRSTRPFAVSFFWNQCIFLHSRVKNVFVYDETLYVWACDFELSKRLHRHGEKIVCFPEYRIVHHGEGSGSHNSLKRILGVLNGEYTYISIAYGRIAFIIHLAAIVARLVRLFLRMAVQRDSDKLAVEKTVLHSHFSLLNQQYFRGAQP